MSVYVVTLHTNGNQKLTKNEKRTFKNVTIGYVRW